MKKAIGLIILSAGESSRMGKPKQLLKFQGRSLLENAARTANNSACDESIIVLGANAEILKNEIKDFTFVINKDWKKGMSSSIKTGLKRLLELDRDLNAVVIMVCDQPFVTEKIIDELIKKYLETNSLIVAAEYAETLGVPALFDRRLFDDLLNLNEKSGAKSLIKKLESQTASIDFPQGKFDIDTPEDYAELLQADFLV